MTLTRVRAWFQRLPNYERDLPLLVVDGVAYTPRAALTEVERGTALGQRLQALIETGRFGTSERQLAKLRLKEMLKVMPERPLVATLLIPERVFTPSQLANEIQRETAIGRQWIQGEISHMKYLLTLR